MSAAGDGATHHCTVEEVTMARGTSRQALRAENLPAAVGLHSAGARAASTTGFGALS